MSRNNDHITGSLLEYLYHQKYYKHIGTDYEDKQIQVFLKKWMFWKNYKRRMVQQCFFLVKSSKKLSETVL